MRRELRTSSYLGKEVLKHWRRLDQPYDAEDLEVSEDVRSKQRRHHIKGTADAKDELKFVLASSNERLPAVRGYLQNALDVKKRREHDLKNER